MTAGERGDMGTLVTLCGRGVEVGVLRLDGTSGPIGVVRLKIGPEHTDGAQLWAALSSTEARELGRRLLAQAVRAERVAGSKAPASGADAG